MAPFRFESTFLEEYRLLRNTSHRALSPDHITEILLCWIKAVSPHNLEQRGSVEGADITVQVRNDLQ